MVNSAPYAKNFFPTLNSSSTFDGLLLVAVSLNGSTYFLGIPDKAIFCIMETDLMMLLLPEALAP